MEQPFVAQVFWRLRGECVCAQISSTLCYFPNTFYPPTNTIDPWFLNTKNPKRGIMISIREFVFK